MNHIRNGKIARLSQPLREELNRRLDQGAPGGPLLQWLNSLSEVQAVLTADFGGRPINKQSLSQWRRGGYAEWWRQQETRALAGQSAGPSPSTDPMAAWIAARCLLAVRAATGPGGEAAPLKILHEACRDLMALRQENHTAARVQFELVRCQLLSGLQLDSMEPCPEPPKTEAVVVARATKPACRGHAKTLPNNPATRFYSAGFCRLAPPPSAPVSPGQTFEILNIPMNPESAEEKSPPAWPRISDFGFPSDFGLRPSDFPSASAPVRPGQTFEILKFSREPRAGRKKSPPVWPRISNFGFLSDFGLRPSDFPRRQPPCSPP